MQWFGLVFFLPSLTLIPSLLDFKRWFSNKCIMFSSTNWLFFFFFTFSDIFHLNDLRGKTATWRKRFNIRLISDDISCKDGWWSQDFFLDIFNFCIFYSFYVFILVILFVTSRGRHNTQQSFCVFLSQLQDLCLSKTNLHACTLCWSFKKEISGSGQLDNFAGSTEWWKEIHYQVHMTSGCEVLNRFQSWYYNNVHLRRTHTHWLTDQCLTFQNDLDDWNHLTHTHCYNNVVSTSIFPVVI